MGANPICPMPSTKGKFGDTHTYKQGQHGGKLKKKLRWYFYKPRVASKVSESGRGMDLNFPPSPQKEAALSSDFDL